MVKVLLTTQWVKIINNKEFTKTALDENIKAFVIHIAFFSLRQIIIYPAWKAQIALLLTEKVTVLTKYLNFANIFSKKSAVELFKKLEINKYVIDLELNKQPFYGPIYSLRPIELETLKTYIKINLANDFLRPSNFLIKASIPFVQKPDSNFHLCVDY